MNKFSNIPVRLTVRTCVLFEKMTGRSFYTCGEEDMVMLAYCCFQAAPGAPRMLYDDFVSMLENKSFAEWLLTEIKKDEDYNSQFVNLPSEHEEKEKGSKDVQFISQLAAILITNGVDAKYMMDEMPLYELQGYIDAIELKKEDALANDRLWCWLSMMPHLTKESSRKLDSPDKLLPFPWEIEAKKKNKEKEFADMKDSIAAFFKTQDKKKEEESNEQG